MLGIFGVGKMSSKVSSMVSFWSKIFSGAKELAGCFLEERTHTRSGTISIKSVKYHSQIMSIARVLSKFANNNFSTY